MVNFALILKISPETLFWGEFLTPEKAYKQPSSIKIILEVANVYCILAGFSCIQWKAEKFYQWQRRELWRGFQ